MPVGISMADVINPLMEILAIIGGMVTGFYALIRYFLVHLEKKNGHLERIANKFNETIQGHLASSQVIQEGIKEAVAAASLNSRELTKSIDNLSNRITNHYGDK